MALSIPSRDTVVSQALTFLRNRFPGRDSHTESFLGKFARVLAALIWGFHQSVKQADNDSLPSDKTSTQGLDDLAFAYGVPADTDGTYGRKGATAATSGVAQCTGTNGTVFTDGLTLLASDGVTQIELVGAVTIPGVPPGTGTVSGSFVAVTTGTAGNLGIGEVLTWEAPPVGADPTVTLTAALSGAVDEETDAALLQRILDRLQIPPKGGTASDYRTWAESVSGEDGTVDRAYVYPLRGGSGTVHVLITQAGSGASRKPDADLQQAVDDYVNGTATEEGQRPVTVDGYETVLPFTAPSGLAIRIRMVESLPKYAFDWDLGSTTFTVDSYAAGPPGVITMTQTPPASLKAAADAGLDPRIQVIIPGTVIPVQVKVTAVNTGAKTLTLQNPLPAGFGAPANGYAVYPGGPMVATTAADILEYVDGLGPSRQGGYANELDPWEDTVAISRLEQVALDSVDEDGVKFSKNVTATTINGVSVDVVASDDGVNGVELLYADSIAVTD